MSGFPFHYHSGVLVNRSLNFNDVNFFICDKHHLRNLCFLQSHENIIIFIFFHFLKKILKYLAFTLKGMIFLKLTFLCGVR